MCGSQRVEAQAVSVRPDENSEDGVLRAASDKLGKSPFHQTGKGVEIQIQEGRTLGSEK